MTEAEWLVCEDPSEMLQRLEGTASDRKLRLFAVACCRRLVRLSNVERLLPALEASEQFAVGRSTLADLLRAWQAADRAVWAFHGVISEQIALGAVEKATVTLAAAECTRACQDALKAFEQERQWLPWEARSSLWWSAMQTSAARIVGDERVHQADLLRCIFMPFRGAKLNPSWVTPAVLDFARSIDDEPAFGRMPALASLLEDAGCDDADILTHGRTRGGHARGCWVVDAILGRT